MGLGVKGRQQVVRPQPVNLLREEYATGGQDAGHFGVKARVAVQHQFEFAVGKGHRAVGQQADLFDLHAPWREAFCGEFDVGGVIFGHYYLVRPVFLQL
jgi:hypothetical protein